MTVPSLGKFLVPATLAAGAIFSVLTAPLALFGSEPITIEMKESRVFEGSLKEIAAPYLGLAGVLSLGMGVTGVALAGWRQSSRQSEQLDQQVSGMQHQLKEKESQLQEFLLTDKQLETSGLQFFLDDEASAPRPQVAQASVHVARSIVQTNTPVVQPVLFSVEPTATTSQSETCPQVAVHTAVSPLQAAQSFLSFSRTGNPASASAIASSTQEAPVANGAEVAQISELQNQLQQILSQMEMLQNIAWTAQSTLEQRAAAADPAKAVLPQMEQRLQKLESQWMLQRVAS